MDRIRKTKKVIDMMISMHACMRDTHQKKVFTVNTLFFATAILLNSLVFTNPTDLNAFGINISEESSSFLIALSSLSLFFISVLLLLVKWREKAAKHDDAVKQLSDLKIEAGKLIGNENGITHSNINYFLDKYSNVCSMITPIPEKKFNYLKHKHYHKVAFSKFISSHHNTSYIIAKIQFWLANDSKSGTE